METKTILENLNWRYATKQFDPLKKVSEKDLNTLLEVVRLSPSSYGLQPIKVLVIQNKDIREKLKEKSFGQTQITDASHLIVLCSYLNINDFHVDQMLDDVANTREIELNQLSGYGDYIKGRLNLLEQQVKKEWNIKQSYIALGLLINACAHLRIDSTPMEGFDSSGYDEVLGLKERNLHASVICPIGYRSSEDYTQHYKKVRKKISDFVEFI